MKQLYFLMVFLIMATSVANAQYGINDDNSAPDTLAILDVKSNTKGFLPPRMTLIQRYSIVFPATGLMIYNTTDHQPNYWNGTKWMNFDGTVSQTLDIGDSYQGGIIAYILKPGDPGYIAGEFHGFISSPSDLSSGIEWGCYGEGVVGGTSLELGTGQSNTEKINAGCYPNPPYAASICYDFSYNGYSDWYLPSRNELLKLFNNRAAIGGFHRTTYWSSSGNGPVAAYFVDFNEGGSGYVSKNNLKFVRAIRSF